MKVWTNVLAVLAILGVAGLALAQGEGKPKHEKKPAGLSGVVVKVDGTNLIIKVKDKEVTVATDANTKVTIDGAEGALAAIKEGMKVKVTPAEGTAATIDATTPKPKAPKAPKNAD